MTSGAPPELTSATLREPGLALAESYAHCVRLARREAGNFFCAFLTLRGDQFRAMCALYAYMRITDDLGDDVGVPADERARRLDAWEAGLHQALAGRTDGHAVWPALADAAARYAIPAEHLAAVIAGVRRDLGAVRFETFAELEEYCYLVAGAVGLCCIRIWGCRDERAHAAAIECGLALQLTNILRDLREDALLGRVYLPQEDLRRFDYRVEDLRDGVRDARFDRLMEFEVARARGCYERGARLEADLDPAGRRILRTMLGIYGGLLREIERRRYDVYSRRVRVPAWKKLLLLARHVCLPG